MPKSKRLQSVAKECRYLLEKDLADQFDETADSAVRESALTFFLELAAIRCFEEQLWKIPSHLPILPNYTTTLEQIEIARKRFYSALSFLPLKKRSPAIFPSWKILKIILHHLITTISPAEWRTEHILGWLYQYFDENSTAQKQQGRFYTPEPIAEYIVAQAFDMLRRSKPETRPSSLSILDLACGAGAFALRAFEHVYSYYKYDREYQAQNVASQIFEHNLFLIDNDPWACRIAAINLYLKAKCLEPTCQIHHMNIVSADALKRWEHEPDGALKKIFTQQYQLIVGNPPYIVINQLRTSKERIRLYKSYQSAAFKINTFALFIERGLDLLTPGGMLGMIVPNTFLTQVYFEPLRKYILAASAVRKILDTKRMFENAFVENCIVLLERGQNAADRHHNVIECQGRSVEKASFQQKHSISDSTECLVHIPQGHFEKAPFNMFNIHIDEPTFVLMEKVANGNPKLGEICESHDGVNPGNARQKLIVTERRDDSCKKVLNGKNIGRYWLKWGGLYVRYDRSILSKGDNVRWGHRPSLDSAKILTRQTADRLIGTFEEGRHYTTNSIHTTILQEGIQEFSLKYILALLNSKLMSFYYRKLISEAGQVFSQVKLINLRQLPIRSVRVEKHERFVKEVKVLLEAKKNDLNIGHQEGKRTTRYDKGLSHAENNHYESLWWQIREQEDLLDQQVYELYQLTSEEIQLIEQDFGPAVCLYPRVPADELKKEISHDVFQRQSCDHIQTIFLLAQQFRVHPESLMNLRERYDRI